MSKIYFTITGTKHHYTILGENMSVGRFYDKMGDEAYGVVKFKLPDGVLCELSSEVVVKRN